MRVTGGEYRDEQHRTSEPFGWGRGEVCLSVGCLFVRVCCFVQADGLSGFFQMTVRLL